MTTPTPDRVTQHLDCVPQRFQVMPEYQGIIQLARELQSDLAAAQERIREAEAERDKYKRLFLGDDPSMGDTVQYRRELVKLCVSDKERAEGALAELKQHAKAVAKALPQGDDDDRDWAQQLDDLEEAVDAYRAAHPKDAP